MTDYSHEFTMTSPVYDMGNYSKYKEIATLSVYWRIPNFGDLDPNEAEVEYREWKPRCPYCGVLAIEDDRFCDRCGAPR